MPDFSRTLLTAYSKVYGENKEITSEELSALDKVTWAKVLARLNNLARTRSNYSIDQVIGDWFSADNAEYANEIFWKIVNGYAQIGVDHTGLTTINIWTNLTVLDRILGSLHQPEHMMDNSGSEKQLLDIYLAINEIFGEKTDQIFGTVSENDVEDIVDRFARITLTLLISYHDLNHFKAVELLIVNFIKSYYCFRFLEESHTELLMLFLKQYGVDNWRDYLKGILPIANHAIAAGDDSGLNYLNLDGHKDKEQARKFLDFLALVDDTNYKSATDFLHARSKPLFKVGEDNYLILDSVLAVNRIYNSMFFELLRLAEKNTKINPRYGDFFSLYTYDYIEKYFSYKILNKIYEKTNYFKISGEDIVAKYNIDAEPDFYVRNGNKAFIFEVKGSVVTGASKQSFVYGTIENELRSKYFFNHEDNEKKAVAQLVERIHVLFSGNAVYDERYNQKNIKAFPILVVSELALTTPGINYLLNQWFWEEVEKYEDLKLNKHRICPLVVMDMDFLVLYSQKLQQKGLFESLIHDYVSHIDKRRVPMKPKGGITAEQLEKSIMRCLIPFSAFVRDRFKTQTPDIFMEFGKDVLGDS